MADYDQWVNLPKDDAFLGDGITSLERLGPVRFKVRFKKDQIPSNYAFALRRLTPRPYAGEERDRNKHFRSRFVRGAGSNEGKKEVEGPYSFKLAGAGGLEYKLRATAEGKESESSKTVITKRRLYYQSVAMDDVTVDTASLLTQMEGDFWNEDKKYYIQLLKKHPDQTIEGPRALIEGQNEQEFLTKLLKEKYQLGDKLTPYGFIVAWVNYLAEEVEVEVDQGDDATVGGNHPDWQWDANTKSLTIDTRKSLWYGLEPADDPDPTRDEVKAWFVHFMGMVVYDDNDSADIDSLSDAAWITGETIGPEGGYRDVKIDLSSKVDKDKKVVEINFYLKVKTASFSAGITLPQGNKVVIMVSTKGLWEPATKKEMEVTLNHEVGHFLGMVADGKGRHPDKPGYYYEGLGHDGPHCMNGAMYDFAESSWSGTPKCLMFGEIPGEQPRTFCDDCAKAVQKLDLGPPTR